MPTATSMMTADHPSAAPHGATLAELSLALGGFALGTGEFASMGLLPNVAHDVHVTVPTAGHMISAYALGVVLGAPLLTVIFARAGRRSMLIGLMVFFACANLLCAAASSYGLIVAARFLAGVPHGAYFGIASLVAASLVPPDRRAQAVARMMLGLSSANIVGVPFATWVGQAAGWRAAFVVVAAIGLTTAILCRVALAPSPTPSNASPLTELSALRKGQVWLTLGIAAIGFGGVFAVYSYITPLLTQVSGMTEAHVPFVLSVIGMGMVGGSLFGGWLADRGVMRAIWITLALNVVTLGMVAITAQSIVAVTINLFFVGFAALSMGPPLQTRLMDIAADAQALAASLNHSAFNLANALGAWLGGVAITAGLGWTSTGPIGVMLALGGLAIWFVSWKTSASVASRARTSSLAPTINQRPM